MGKITKIPDNYSRVQSSSPVVRGYQARSDGHGAFLLNNTPPVESAMPVAQQPSKD